MRFYCWSGIRFGGGLYCRLDHMVERISVHIAGLFPLHTIRTLKGVRKAAWAGRFRL